MSEVINFNKARKARDKAKAGADARIARAKTGRTKTEKTRQEAENERLGRVLDDAKRGDEDEGKE